MCCIVGYGAIGPFHAKIFKDLPNAKLYAICDNNPEKLERAAKDFPDAKLYSNYDEAYYNSDEWRGKWATEVGGLLINQAIHTIDLLGYL
ncbi:MAG: hypothetical protein E7401_00325 [Ruminococcaceae bacterium]|nr:hypothetical protein [Oscillospiraceae bacterium]